MLIRAIVEADSHALREMGRETWRDSYGTRVGPRADAAIAASLDGDAIRSMFADDGGCLVALDAEALLGSVCFVERRTIAYVWGLYVRPDHQRGGIGTALIRQAVRTFTSAEWVDLSAVDDQALAFYRKLGFVEQGPGEVDLVAKLTVATTRLIASVSDLRDASRP